MKKKHNWRLGLKHFAQFMGVLLLELFFATGYVVLSMMVDVSEICMIAAAALAVLMNLAWFGLLVRTESKVINGILIFMYYLASLVDILGGILMAFEVVASIQSSLMRLQGDVLGSLLSVGVCAANFFLRRNIMDELITEYQAKQEPDNSAEKKEPIDDSPVFHEPGQYGTKTLTAPVQAVKPRQTITTDDLIEVELPETLGGSPKKEPEPESEPEQWICGTPFIWQQEREQKAAKLAAMVGIKNEPGLAKILLIMEDEKTLELMRERERHQHTLQKEKRKLRRARAVAIICSIFLCACVGLGVAGCATGVVTFSAEDFQINHDSRWNTMRNAQVNLRKNLTRYEYDQLSLGMSWDEFYRSTDLPLAMKNHPFNKVYLVSEDGTTSYYFYFKDGRLASKKAK